MTVRAFPKLLAGAAALAVVLVPSPSRSTLPGSNGLIVFAQEKAYAGGVFSSELMLLDPHTGKRTNLTRSGLFENQPSWSPDGRRVAYSSEGYLSSTSPGREVRVLVEAFVASGVTVFPWNPTWSPDGTRVAFGVYDESGRTGIGVAPLGGRPRLIVPLGQSVTMNPQWSPDGRWIAFERYGAETDGFYLEADVLTVRPDGDMLRNLTADTLKDHRPTWTPDGDLMFISRRGCAAASVESCEDVYLMKPDGTSVRRVTEGPHDWGGDGEIDRIAQAEAAPDGRSLLVSINPRALTDQAPTEVELWRVDLETGAKTRLLDSFNFWFDWQPRCDVIGTTGDDVLRGSARDDLICGLGGADVIRGMGGDDVLFGHGGNDRIVGGHGRDIVVGNPGRDRCDRDDLDHSRVC